MTVQLEFLSKNETYNKKKFFIDDFKKKMN